MSMSLYRLLTLPSQPIQGADAKEENDQSQKGILLAHDRPGYL